LLHNLVELLELVVDDLGTHRVTDTVPVDEHVVRQLALVVIAEGLERALEVTLQDAGADNLLALLALRTCLRVVFAHVLVVRGAKTNDALLAFVANINADQHGFSRYFCPEVEPPEVATELGVDLTQNVDVDSVIVLLNGLARNELRDDWAVSVDFILQSSVKVLLLDGVGHDDQEEVQILRLPRLGQLPPMGVGTAHVLEVVVVDGLLECLDA
jgi:hypothetical protein